MSEKKMAAADRGRLHHHHHYQAYRLYERGGRQTYITSSSGLIFMLLTETFGDNTIVAVFLSWKVAPSAFHLLACAPVHLEQREKEVSWKIEMNHADKNENVSLPVQVTKSKPRHTQRTKQFLPRPKANVLQLLPFYKGTVFAGSIPRLQ